MENKNKEMEYLQNTISDKTFLLVESSYHSLTNKRLSFYYNLVKDYDKTRASCYVTELPAMEVSFQQFYNDALNKRTTAVMTIVGEINDMFKYKSYHLKHNYFPDSETLELIAVDNSDYSLEFKRVKS